MSQELKLINGKSVIARAKCVKCERIIVVISDYDIAYDIKNFKKESIKKFYKLLGSTICNNCHLELTNPMAILNQVE